MPYIDQERRKAVLDILGDGPQTKGELCFYYYTMSLAFIEEQGRSYQNISDAIAALNDAAHELRRRVLDPYEDKKIVENGDIL